MTVRSIIKIDEEECVGCGKCVNTCPNGALELVDGKARLVGELRCDGFGICMGECPSGALTIEEREAPEFAGEERHTRPAQQYAETASRLGVAEHEVSAGCPGRMQRQFGAFGARGGNAVATDVPSALSHWPIQLGLANPASAAYRDMDVLIAADCTGFSMGAFHARLLEGRSLIIACPLLDDGAGYIEKLTALFREAGPTSVTIARMEVPCCGGLVRLVSRARREAGSEVSLREVVIGVEGRIVSERELS